MANGMNNADKLLERILGDARGEAARMAAEAKAQAEGIEARAAQEAEAIGADAKARAQAAHKEALEHAETAAQLDARKQALAARRAVLEEAFAAALKELCAMEGEGREALLVKTAAAEADGGETLCPAKADEAAASAVVEKANAILAADGRKALTLGKVNDAIAGGFTLQSQGYEKDCSFEAMLREARDRLEGGVAKRLFG